MHTSLQSLPTGQKSSHGRPLTARDLALGCHVTLRTWGLITGMKIGRTHSGEQLVSAATWHEEKPYLDFFFLKQSMFLKARIK